MSPARHWTSPWQRSQQRSTGRRRPVQRRDIWTASAGNDDRSTAERRYKQVHQQVLESTRRLMASLAAPAAVAAAAAYRAVPGCERSPLYVINTIGVKFELFIIQFNSSNSSKSSRNYKVRIKVRRSSNVNLGSQNPHPKTTQCSHHCGRFLRF